MSASGARPERGNDAIERYYDETWADYRWLWLDLTNLAFHFGYYRDGIATHAEALENANRELADRAAIGSGSRVLDAGCGAGGSALWLARARDARVVGITVARSQVTIARRMTARHGRPRAEFLVGDFTRTPFGAGTFDAVWALESLCHAREKRRFYAEAARLLRPGGRLVVSEYMRAARPLDAMGETRVRTWSRGWAIPDLDTQAEHREHAAAAGLVDVALEDYTAYVRPSLRRLYRIAFTTYPLALTARCLRMRTAVQHGNTRAALVQYRSLERGDWRYGILSATKPS